MYRSLKPDKIVETARRLQSRILERFPESSLGRFTPKIWRRIFFLDRAGPLG